MVIAIMQIKTCILKMPWSLDCIPNIFLPIIVYSIKTINCFANNKHFEKV